MLHTLTHCIPSMPKCLHFLHQFAGNVEPKLNMSTIALIQVTNCWGNSCGQKGHNLATHAKIHFIQTDKDPAANPVSIQCYDAINFARRPKIPLTSPLDMVFVILFDRACSSLCGHYSIDIVWYLRLSLMLPVQEPSMIAVAER